MRQFAWAKLRHCHSSRASISARYPALRSTALHAVTRKLSRSIVMPAFGGFACLHVRKLECVLSGEWACPECVGQQTYDEKLSGQIRVSRERWLAGKMNAKERDGFSQLVFDLYCSCNWSEWKINVDALISDNKMRLERDPSYLPTMLPFQSLHYPLEKNDMKRIAQAYAKTTEVKVYRAYRMAESRIREQRKRKNNEGRERTNADLAPAKREW